MIIFCQSFISLNQDDRPCLVRQKAILFANKVNETGELISISETAVDWENSVTVWYKSKNRVEIK